MRGHYKVYKSGLLVAEADNVITTFGHQIILQYLAALNSSWADFLAVGTSSVAATTADTALGFEFTRGPIVAKSADYTTNIVTVKADISEPTAGWIYELGVYPATTSTSEASQGTVLVDFDPDVNNFSAGTYNTTNYRLGAESLQLVAAPSATTTANDSTFSTNFSSYSNFDKFALGFFINDAFSSAIIVRFKTDSSNYFSYSFAPGTVVGYKIVNFFKTNFTSTGAPSWDNINQIEFAVTATSGGTTTVQLDGISIIDQDTTNSFALVSRAILGAPIYKDINEQLDVEYAVSFS